MQIAITDLIPIAAILGGWEVMLILAVFLLLIGARKLPEIARGLGNGISEFRKELDRHAHDAGRSAGGIFGKPAAEALTPDNQLAELYDPAVFGRGSAKRSVHQLLRDLWRRLLASLKIKR